VIELLLQYGLFLAKTATVLMALLIVIVAIGTNAGHRRRPSDEGDIDVVYLNDRLRDYGDVMRESVLDKHALKVVVQAGKAGGQTKRQGRKECGQ
jgi:serine protease SohB